MIMRIKKHEGEEEGCPLLWQVVIISVYVTKTCLIIARQTFYGNSKNFTQCCIQLKYTIVYNQHGNYLISIIV